MTYMTHYMRDQKSLETAMMQNGKSLTHRVKEKT